MGLSAAAVCVSLSLCLYRCHWTLCSRYLLFWSSKLEVAYRNSACFWGQKCFCELHLSLEREWGRSKECKKPTLCSFSWSALATWRKPQRECLRDIVWDLSLTTHFRLAFFKKNLLCELWKKHTLIWNVKFYLSIKKKSCTVQQDLLGGAPSENSDISGEVVRWQQLIWLECDLLQYIAMF